MSQKYGASQLPKSQAILCRLRVGIIVGMTLQSLRKAFIVSKRSAGQP